MCQGKSTCSFMCTYDYIWDVIFLYFISWHFTAFPGFWLTHVWNCWHMLIQRACSENLAPSFGWKHSGWVMAEADFAFTQRSWPWELSNKTDLCFVWPGKAGCGWGVLVSCTSLWCSRSSEAVLQGAARTSDTHRAARGLSQGPAAPHWGREDLCNHAAVLCTARQKSKRPASLFRLPSHCV